MSERTDTPRGDPGRLDPAILKLSAVVVTGTVAAMLDMTMVTVALAGMTRAFGEPVTTVQWVNTAYLLTIAMVVPVTGRLAERFGTRNVWMVALVAFLAGSVLCGAAWSASSLIAFRVVQGLGGGMIVPLGIMILVGAAGPERRGRVMAVAAVPTQFAPIVGPLVGGLIVDGIGWRWIFYINVPVCLLALLLSYRGIPDSGRRSAEAGSAAGSGAGSEAGTVRGLDLPGLALLSPAIALVVYGLARTSLPLTLAGGVLLLAYVGYALRVTGAPVVDPRLFAHRALAAASVLNFVSRLSVFGALLLIPLYYQQVRGHTALVAGLLLVPQSLGTMLALPYVGSLTDRIGARPVILTGIGVTTLGALVFARVTAHTPDLLLALALFVWGTGIAAVAVPVASVAYQGLDPARIPGATSAITMVQTIGASVGAAVLTAILANRTGHHPDGETARAFADTFRWVTGFTVLAVVPALLLPVRRRSSELYS